MFPPFFFNSTALILEEPTSRPTIVFDPIPNMCARLFVFLRLYGAGTFARVVFSTAFSLLASGSLHGRLPLVLRSEFHLARLLFHPLVELRFFEAPAVAQFESRNLLLANVLVKRVRTHSQILGGLANVHHFS